MAAHFQTRSTSLSFFPPIEEESPVESVEKSVTILSCDGGGVRGVILAVYLSAIEEYTRHPISKLFDYAAGTSIGSFVVSALSIPDKNDPTKAKYTASQVLRILKKQLHEIFPSGIFDQFRKIRHIFSGSLYDPNGISKVANKIFEGAKMRETLTEVVIPLTKLNPTETVLITSKRCRGFSVFNELLLEKVCAISSAAPVYFEPRQLFQKEGPFYMDGGMLMNNPTQSVCTEAKIDHPKAQLIVLSLGTGVYEEMLEEEEIESIGVDDIFTLFDMNMKGSSQNVHNRLQQKADRKVHKFKYLRLQPEIPKDLEAMDNASEDNIKALIQVACEDIKRNSLQIRVFCDRIMKAKGLTKISET